MRWPRLVLATVLCCTGCTHLSLERNTLSQIGTLSELRAQEVMNNAAALAANPSALPFFSVIRAGSAQVEDTGRIDSRTLWRNIIGGTSTGFWDERLLLALNRRKQENWTLDPIYQPKRLAAMRCAYRWVLGGPDTYCEDCADQLAHFKVLTKLQKLPPGWIGVGKKHDVPRDACYSSHCSGTYVWITPDGLEALSLFTLILLEIATVDMESLTPEPATKAVSTAEYTYEGDKVKSVKMTTTLVDAKTGEIVTGRQSVSSSGLERLDANLRSLINLRR